MCWLALCSFCLIVSSLMISICDKEKFLKEFCSCESFIPQSKIIYHIKGSLGYTVLLNELYHFKTFLNVTVFLFYPSYIFISINVITFILFVEAAGTVVWCSPVSFSDDGNLYLLPCLSQLSIRGLTVLSVLTFLFLFSLLHIHIELSYGLSI